MRNSLLILSCCGAIVCSAQDTTSLSTKDFEMPSSPAFILMDNAPSVIERPNSGRAFAVSIFNSVTANKGLPQNYAVEFTPFWYFRHPNMTALRYAGYAPTTESTKGYKQNVFHQAARGSVSAAFISSEDTLSTTPVTNLSFGYRTTLFALRSKKQMQAIRLANDSVVNSLRNQKARMDAAGINSALAANSPDEYRIRVAAFIAGDSAAAKSRQRRMAKALEAKPIVALDVAFGYNAFFLNNNFYDNHFGRFGAWSTLNVALPLGKTKDGVSNYLNIYAVGRYLADGTEHSSDSAGTYIRKEYSDFGMKLELEFDRLSIGYEYVTRNGTGNYHSFRSNGLIKYQLTDRMFLTGAFGKNFGKDNNLISLLGINWGITSGTEKVTTPAAQ